VKQGKITSLKLPSHVILLLPVLLQNKKPRRKSSTFSSWY